MKVGVRFLDEGYFNKDRKKAELKKGTGVFKLLYWAKSSKTWSDFNQVAMQLIVHLQQSIAESIGTVRDRKATSQWWLVNWAMLSDVLCSELNC